MGNDNDTIRLLIHAESQNEAESMIGLMRNAGHSTRVHLIQSIEDLSEQLNNHGWDLLLSRYQTKHLTAKEIIKQINRHGRDVPAILVHDEPNSMIVEQALKMGAEDVVPTGENNHLMLVIERELRHRLVRRQLREAEVAVRETEKRNQLLLESSKDAIAYVHEGMHIYANDAYIELFEYEDADDLAGMPIIDMVASSDLNKFKDFLKKYSSGEERSGNLNCQTLTQTGKPFNAKMIFSPALYEDEPCTQIVIRQGNENADLEEKLKEVSRQDLLTGLFNKQYFIEQLGAKVDSAVLNGDQAAVMYINIDKFAKAKTDVGIDGSDMVVSDIATLIKHSVPSGSLIARIGEDVFGIISPKLNAEEAMSAAEKIRHDVEEHMVEVKQRTLRLTISIGLSLINDNSPSPNEVLSRAHQASDFVRKLEGHQNGNGVYLYSTATMAETDEERLVGKIEEAIKKNAFNLYYQPIVSIHGLPGEHYEVTISLPEADGSELPASKFMNSQMDPNLVAKVDRWVISTAAKKLAEQRARGKDVRLLINLSSQSLKNIELVKQVGGLAKKAKLPGDSLIFQFGEVDVLAHLKQAQQFSKAVHVLGFKMAVSQFGGGVDPFEITKHVQIDFVILDEQYSDDIANKPESIEGVTQLITQLQAKEIFSVMPKIESPTVLANLWTSGVQFIQGMYLQGPHTEMNYNFEEED